MDKNGNKGYSYCESVSIRSRTVLYCSTRFLQRLYTIVVQNLRWSVRHSHKDPPSIRPFTFIFKRFNTVIDFNLHSKSI